MKGLAVLFFVLTVGVGLHFATEKLHPGVGGLVVLALALTTLACLATPAPVHIEQTPPVE